MNKAQRAPWHTLAAELTAVAEVDLHWWFWPCAFCRYAELEDDGAVCLHPSDRIQERVENIALDGEGDCWAFRPTEKTVEGARAHWLERIAEAQKELEEENNE